MIALLPGNRPSALQIVAHGQQMTLLGSYHSAEVQLAYSRGSAARAINWILNDTYQYLKAFYFLNMQNWIAWNGTI